jgi:hypothetical protein
MDVDTVKVVQKTIVVPEHIEYPAPRVHVPTMSKGDKLIVDVTVKDEFGVVKFNEVNKISLKEYPLENEVIGRVAVNLVEQTKTVVA